MSQSNENPPFTLSEARLAIIGLGLMGGSIAMALRGHCRTLSGFDLNPQALQLAIDHKIVDQASDQAAEILSQADVVILAVPVLSIIEWIQRIPELVPAPAIVMDLGSTKEQICQALEGLPARFDPIGGHPMTGKETSGITCAEASLYRDTTFALTPLARTTLRARQMAEEIVRVVGAMPLWLNPAAHDHCVAATSHIPYLVSAALALGTPEEYISLIGPGFRSTARLAGSDPRMMTEILFSNRTSILEALARFRQQLDWLENNLGDEEQAAMTKILTRVQNHRQVLLTLDDS